MVPTARLSLNTATSPESFDCDPGASSQCLVKGCGCCFVLFVLHLRCLSSCCSVAVSRPGKCYECARQRRLFLTPTRRSHLSYKGHSLALHTSIFGSGYRGFGQGPPQFYGEVPFSQATKEPRIYVPAGFCSSPVAPRTAPRAGTRPNQTVTGAPGEFLPMSVPPQMQKRQHRRSHRKAGSRRQCARPPAQLLPTGPRIGPSLGMPELSHQ